MKKFAKVCALALAFSSFATSIPTNVYAAPDEVYCYTREDITNLVTHYDKDGNIRVKPNVLFDTSKNGGEVAQIRSAGKVGQLVSSDIDVLAAATGGGSGGSSGGGDSDTGTSASLKKRVEYVMDFDLLSNAKILEKLGIQNQNAQKVLAVWNDSDHRVAREDGIDKYVDYKEYLNAVNKARLEGKELTFEEYAALETTKEAQYAPYRVRYLLEDGKFGEEFRPKQVYALESPKLLVDDTDNYEGEDIKITFTDNEDWRNSIDRIYIGSTEVSKEDIEIEAGYIQIPAGRLSKGEHRIEIYSKDDKYKDVVVVQSIIGVANLEAREEYVLGKAVEIKGLNTEYKLSIKSILVNGEELSKDDYEIVLDMMSQKLLINASKFMTEGDYKIEIKADNYKDVVKEIKVKKAEDVKEEIEALTSRVRFEDIEGYENNNKVKIILEEPSRKENKFKYVFIMDEFKAPFKNDDLNKWEDLKSEDILNVVEDVKIGIAEVTKEGKAFKYSEFEVDFENEDKDAKEPEVKLEDGKIYFDFDDSEYVNAVDKIYFGIESISKEDFEVKDDQIIATKTDSMRGNIEFKFEAKGYKSNSKKMYFNQVVENYEIRKTYTEEVVVLDVNDYNWTKEIKEIKLDGNKLEDSKYQINLGSIKLNSELFETEKTYALEILAEGYEDFKVDFELVKKPVEIKKAPELIGVIDAEFATIELSEEYAKAVETVFANTDEIEFAIEENKIKIATDKLREGENGISVKAYGYEDANLNIFVPYSAPNFELEPVMTLGNDIKVKSVSPRFGWTTSIEKIMIGEKEAVYSVENNTILLDKSNFAEAGSFEILISAKNYRDAKLTLEVEKAEEVDMTTPELKADETEATKDKEIEITFKENAHWRKNVKRVKVSAGFLVKDVNFRTEAGKLIIEADQLSTGTNEITVYADGFDDAKITQEIEISEADLKDVPTLKIESEPVLGEDINIKFSGGDYSWSGFMTKKELYVNEEKIEESKYRIESLFGNIKINGDVFNKAGMHRIEVKVKGYKTAQIEIEIKEPIKIEELTGVTFEDVKGIENNNKTKVTLPELEEGEIYKYILEKVEKDAVKDVSSWLTLTSGDIIDAKNGQDITVVKVADKKVISHKVFAAVVENEVEIKDAPSVAVDTDDNFLNKDITLTFDANKNWQDAITEVTIGEHPLLQKPEYEVADGKITVKTDRFFQRGYNEVRIFADGYETLILSQELIEKGPELEMMSYPEAGKELMIKSVGSDYNWDFFMNIERVELNGVDLAEKLYKCHEGETRYMSIVLNEETISKEGVYNITIHSKHFTSSSLKMLVE